MGWMEFFLIAAIALSAASLFLLMRLQQDIRKVLFLFLEREAQARKKNDKPNADESDTTC